jgi:hypothetical protein
VAAFFENTKVENNFLNKFKANIRLSSNSYYFKNNIYDLVIFLIYKNLLEVNITKPEMIKLSNFRIGSLGEILL